MQVKFVKSNPTRNDILIVDTNQITGFKESGKGFDITFNNQDNYYFSLNDAEYLVNQIFHNTQDKTREETKQCIMQF